jgi:hypothetical protein
VSGSSEDEGKSVTSYGAEYDCGIDVKTIYATLGLGHVPPTSSLPPLVNHVH